ncbi:symmetrical bis(5'-nucleosyl)-tetraphosphatase [Psychrobium sp. 1_MG-2023]|uniref:symmetrical bis(5'-nucleosyl)-tetraphosphatase n=1 Tax=Psychrobium sp. 1_MG-2023 TaxID=3062624 RepID=UPI000C3230DF|nr:symmetrical bis(5'-nucleosyl)-tetraphosphatase [Psychrobium sp. 1_MG-2023]MDP2559584.1 symmetrical bis(5'-nucleosyl)-tetraphosphatase [Psychrobium sp. 1_MG-2023]PKF59418.1 hypothetical protein CW748_01200 [Alteromonadales bacterium alter-6D02]
MATYFIGDIQACYSELELLLKKIAFNPQRDKLYLAGDLVGRGPQPCEVLDFVLLHRDSVHTVLGNHDLHFLAVSQGIKPLNANDNFSPLLNSPNRAQYIDFLRCQPLLISLDNDNLILSHAGITPQWTLPIAKAMAKKVSQQLQSTQWLDLLKAMYNNQLNSWNQDLTEQQQAIFSISALTRMRYCHHDGQLNFTEKCSPNKLTDHSLVPWFNVNAPSHSSKLIFGHWAALLGETASTQHIALDTGCLWGNHLTAWSLEENKFFQQKSLQ